MKNFINIKPKTIILLFTVLSSIVLLTSCEKLIEVDTPANQLESNNIYTDSATAEATVNGMYSVLYNTTAGGTVTSSTIGTFLTTTTGRCADEIYAPTATDDEFVNNTLTTTTGLVNTMWVSLYQTIYNANKVIEGMEKAALSTTLKKQLIAESKFIRAFCHFHLVNIWGNVPLITQTNVNITSSQGQATASQVYTQIIQDLKDAQANLPTDYLRSANLRTRANTWAATSLLARVYLYTKQWQLAEQESSKVIARSSQFGLPSLNTVFLKTSNETIFAFNTNQFGYPFISRALLPASASVSPALALTPNLLGSFERDALRPNYEDDRFSAWTKAAPSGMRYAYKTISNTAGANTELAVILRLAEQYLIRAEARIQQNKLSDGIADINIIRSRAGLHDTFASNQSELLLAVEHERQIELFLEYGARWYDLKRTERADAVLKPIKGLGWETTDVLFPIPQTQINSNSNLQQNDGYK